MNAGMQRARVNAKDSLVRTTPKFGASVVNG